MIVQELHAIQHRAGWLPEAELRALAERLGVPLHRLHAVASFFPHYRLEPPPALDVKVCRDMACHLRGAPRLHQSLKALAQEIAGPGAAVAGVSCLGQCDGAPAASIQDRVYRNLTDDEWRGCLRAARAGEELPVQRASRAPCGWQVDPYGGEARYEALRRVIERRDFDAVLAALQTADLRGMGGAGFRTHLKWSAVRAAPGPEKYIVCNADESEPGTFKDREILRRAPHLLVEGMAVAGLVAGAAKGYVYIRHEFEEEIEAVREAIERAQAQGLCGGKLLGSDLAFDLEVFVSPGGYICGEESALLEAMEDRRAEPRNKPPFPTTHGLHSKPTVINNVETLAWVPAILQRGGEWYRDAGVNGATGLRFVSVSGDVEKPGVYEVPFGLTVRDLVFQHAGGIRGGQKLKAIAPSGPSSGFLPAVLRAENLPEKFVREKLPPGAKTYDVLDLPLDLGTVPAAGSMLGAAFVVAGDRACMVDMALNCVEFYRNESCGKCVPCRVGSQKLVDIINDLTRGRLARDGLGTIDDLAQSMYLTSICGLGVVAANPITTVIKHFRDEVEEHLRGRCPTGVCSVRPRGATP